MARTTATNHVYSYEDLKTFMSFLVDQQAIDLNKAVTSSIELFNYCSSSREAVLTFYEQLFNEYTTYYWIVKKRSLQSGGTQAEASKSKIEYVGELTRRFYELTKLKMADAREDQQSNDFVTSIPSTSRIRASPSKSSIAGPASPTTSMSCSSPPPNTTKIIPVGPKIIPVSRRTSSCNSNDAIEQTPMSPTAQESDTGMESGQVQYEPDSHGVDIFPALEEMISNVIQALNNLTASYKLNERFTDDLNSSIGKSSRRRERLRATITSWSTELLIQLNIKHHVVASLVATDLSRGDAARLLPSEIDLWLGNIINKLLVDLLLESHSDIPKLFKQFVHSSQSCDWLLAHILLEISKKPEFEKDFSSCLEYIIGNQAAVSSVTSILAYLSDLNPKAMANFPKSNIPFIISLCQTSSSLLNVLAQEIPDSISPDFLNNLAKEAYQRLDSKTHPPFIPSLTHCIMAAPNSYKLFMMTLEVKLDKRVSAEVKSAAQLIIDSISSKIHERSIDTRPFTIHNKPAIDNLLEQISNDLRKLISKCPSSKQIEKKAQEIFHRMSFVYGHLFASKVIAHYLNLPEENFWPILKPLLTKFMKHFADDGSTLVSQTLALDSELRTTTFLNNLHIMTNLLTELKLDLDLISQLLVDKLCAAKFNVTPVTQLIKLCCTSLERVEHERISIGTKHRLCMSLATCYFLLLEFEGDNFPEILSYIRINLTCMSRLKQSSVASHILCRALLERSLVYGHLFNGEFNPDLIGDSGESVEWDRDDIIKLSKENLKVCLGHRFRRLPNHVFERTSETQKLVVSQHCPTNKPDKQSINCYLLIEAFKSSINNIEAFANLFVEFHCPVMFDKYLWPNDEALRVINERNLSILRKFEQIPPLWDLFELIGQAGCLKSCLVLVKALLAAHLALWASATTNSSKDKMISTSRLIPPLAQSGLVPKEFGLTVEVFAHLKPNEVYSVLSDIWQYLKDTNSNGQSEVELSLEEKRAKAKTYLNRLRLFMCQNIPGQLYVKIFKDFQPAV